MEGAVAREVEVLSTKLVASIEKQATLEDEKHWREAALDRARVRIGELEAAQRDCVERMAQVLEEKRGAEEETQALMGRLVEETQQRAAAETEKQAMERELEELTRTLFEEANEMVAAAEDARGRAERRSTQLAAQLEEAVRLQRSQQAQLEELKGLLAAGERARARAGGKLEKGRAGVWVGEGVGGVGGRVRGEGGEDRVGVRDEGGGERVLRMDTAAFEELQEFVRAAGERGRGGTFFGLGSGGWMRESKFVKRCIYEDIEPTLRLDSAPGLSWLARRGMFSAVLEGQLVIEPGKVGRGGIECSLCGKSCTEKGNRRVHRFRTSEAQQGMKFYYLCGYCLGRVRSVCDFAGFLRQLRDGVWRGGGDGGRRVWEETVRLREAMFWARMGVVEGGEGHKGVPHSAGLVEDSAGAEDAVAGVQRAQSL
ncbi:hypothetical protein PMAC_000635 [Pneumocystis sp. 'macacae']|nr:hypothetical protein PMAC_000635 [Pneumocystis sp. 'macacae']